MKLDSIKYFLDDKIILSISLFTICTLRLKYFLSSSVFKKEFYISELITLILEGLSSS